MMLLEMAVLVAAEAPRTTMRPPAMPPKGERLSGSIGSLKRTRTCAVVSTPVRGGVTGSGRKLTQHPGSSASEVWNGAWKRPAPRSTDGFGMEEAERTPRLATVLPVTIPGDVTWRNLSPIVTTSPTAGTARQL